ncbi:hypothetical protein [Novosphingobium sp. UBA1939]|uniref:hypothetical protein n=1 Tax=Novosphingobium sp. UBA1939 TaxID=1946982 RepID=UPI0025E2A055|nr:hypothetical protein [Novosphingobium sp. UBA1939]
MLDWMIRRTVEKTVRETIDAKMNNAIDRAIANNPRIQFVKAMQLRQLAVDPTMDPRIAWNDAVETLKAFCEDENCQFGDPLFDWSEDGAVSLIDEYQIRYWESAP